MTLVLTVRHMTRNKLIPSAMHHGQNPLKLNQFLGISNYGISVKEVTWSRKRYAKMTCEKIQFRIFRSLIPAHILKVSFEWVQLQHNTVVKIR